jgi:uncharacterized delta-60 repeat protein
MRLTSLMVAPTIGPPEGRSMGGSMMTVRRTLSALGSALALIALTAGPTLAAPGDLDAAFGGDGRVTTSFASGFAVARAVAVQDDGKVVAVGETRGQGGRFALARYNPNGSLDTTFGGDGRVTTNFTTGTDSAFGVAVQANGNIVAVGGARGSGGRFALARYNPNGTPDVTFGGDGRVTTNFTTGDDVAAGVAVQANGKIVAAGTAFADCGCNRFALARYNADGTLDTTFSANGRVTTSFAFGGHANAVAIAANGKIVAAGWSSELARFAVARYTPDGSLDTGFSGNGKVATSMGRGETGATGVAIQANGKIVAVGFTDVPHEFGDTFGPGKIAVARFRWDGTLDPAFGGDGRVKTRFGRKNASGEGVAIQSNGKIVAVGRAAGGGRFALARYRPSGTRDTAFGGDGRVTTNFTGGGDRAFGVAIRAGRIVAAGRAGGSGSGGRFAVARYVST